jgi:glutamine kinase
MNSLSTVTRQLTSDVAGVGEGSLSWEALVGRYGHLRPGTYDISTPCYGSSPEQFLRPLLKNPPKLEEQGIFQWSPEQTEFLSQALIQVGLPGDVESFNQFSRQAIEGREYAKFIFTRHLSSALESIAEFGAEVGLSREQLAHLSLADLADLRSGQIPVDSNGWLMERITEGEALHQLTLGVELKPLITEKEDFRGFLFPVSQPNFVSLGTITASVVVMEKRTLTGADLKGCLVLIPQADPGFDWLFGCEIAGLITAYGGANSHMAIRAAEFNLPAAIGVGEGLYERLTQAHIILLDCQNRRIEVVQ